MDTNQTPINLPDALPSASSPHRGHQAYLYPQYMGEKPIKHEDPSFNRDDIMAGSVSRHNDPPLALVESPFPDSLFNSAPLLTAQQDFLIPPQYIAPVFQFQPQSGLQGPHNQAPHPYLSPWQLAAAQPLPNLQPYMGHPHAARPSEPQLLKSSPKDYKHGLQDYMYRDQIYGSISRPSSQNSDRSPRKKLRSETADDVETQLRSLAAQASAYLLPEVAVKVKALDANDGDMKRDPLFSSLCKSRDLKQEKHHQVFALAWIGKSCESSHTAVVPRNRIYARYVQHCSHFNLNPLISTTFFRLIRIMFPNLKTRRLGTRGKSKHHFCGLKLMGDNSQTGSPVSSYSSNALDSSLPLNVLTPLHVDSPNMHQVLATPTSTVPIHEYLQVNNLKYIPGLYDTIERSMTAESMNQPLDIPSIYQFLHKDFEVDYDIADTLHSLYRIQCSSIFELMRFMQVERMFQLFAPTPALLASSVFKLFTNEQLRDWVQACDYVMYRAMLKMLSRLHSQSISKEVTNPLNELAAGFLNHLTAVLNGKYPKPLVTLKLKLARQFVQLLRRLLRCIETGAHAAKVLSSPVERSSMLNDWASLPLHDLVIREIPCSTEHFELIFDLVDKRLPDLLNEEPLKGAVLAKYSKFIFDLPGAFAGANPWLYALLLSNFLTACIREMTMAGSRSFKSWWMVRCWIDEYMSWSLELGGFFHDEHQPLYDFASEKSINANANSSFDTFVADKSATSVSLGRPLLLLRLIPEAGATHNH